MGTHLIPRSNVKGQDRFFIIFSIPGLIGTLIGAIPGYLIYNVIKIPTGARDVSFPGLFVLFIFGAIGFVIGQVQVPDTGSLPLFKKVGGLYIRDVIRNYFKFKRTKKKYVNVVTDTQVFEEDSSSKVEKFLLNK